MTAGCCGLMERSLDRQSVHVRYAMKTLSVGLLLAIASGVLVSPGRSEAPRSPQMSAVGANPGPVAVDPEVASPRPSPRVTRGLSANERNSVLGLVLLVTLQRGTRER